MTLIPDRNPDDYSDSFIAKANRPPGAGATNPDLVGHSGIDLPAASGLRADDGMMAGPDGSRILSPQQAAAYQTGPAYTGDMPSVIPGREHIVVDLANGTPFDGRIATMEANRARAFAPNADGSPSPAPTPQPWSPGAPKPAPLTPQERQQGQIAKAEAEGDWEASFRMKFGQLDA